MPKRFCIQSAVLVRFRTIERIVDVGERGVTAEGDSFGIVSYYGFGNIIRDAAIVHDGVVFGAGGTPEDVGITVGKPFGMVRLRQRIHGFRGVYGGDGRIAAMCDFRRFMRLLF